MAKNNDSSVLVRVYDLGGFGDVAGAMRVASHLQRTGIDTQLKATSPGALEKLKILKPDVVHGNGDIRVDRAIQVDVAGHYGDRRNPFNKDIPHQFTEDMDNPSDRRTEVPIYLKTGLQDKTLDLSVPQGLPFSGNPMFYRSFMEWELPKPGERDARKQILEAAQQKKRKFGFFGKTDFARKLEKFNRIGFAHLSPQVQSYTPEDILEHPYLHAVHAAHTSHSDLNFAVGLFVSLDLERRLTVTGLSRYWNVMGSSGVQTTVDSRLPTLLFLGPQPQTTVTSLFLSSDIPNLVTGDLSLSDAMYGLIAMEGPGFFYETPDWKVPTFIELNKMLEKAHPSLGLVNLVGSIYVDSPWIKFENPDEAKKVLSQGFSLVVKTLADEKASKKYADAMRFAIRSEIKRRFGDVQVQVDMDGPRNGFYIQPGAPYLLQDATARVVETLMEKPDVFAETEKVRRMLRDGVPVRVNMATGVLEPKPAPKPMPQEQHSIKYLDFYSDSFLGNSNGSSYLEEFANKGISSEYDLNSIFGKSKKKKEESLLNGIINSKIGYKDFGESIITDKMKDKYAISPIGYYN